MTDYVPIDCGLHSRYELAVMHRQRLILSWQDETGNIEGCAVRPLDLFTLSGEEFLQVQDDGGGEHLIRLDRITACEFPAGR